MDYNPLALATRQELMEELARRSTTCFLVAAGKDTDDTAWVSHTINGRGEHINVLIEYGVDRFNENCTD